MAYENSIKFKKLEKEKITRFTLYVSSADKVLCYVNKEVLQYQGAETAARQRQILQVNFFVYVECVACVVVYKITRKSTFAHPAPRPPPFSSL